MSTYKLVCPHCHGKMRIRSSDGTHIFLRLAYLQCTNEVCGWSCKAQFEMTHELSPSGMPNPSVQLPKAPLSVRRTAMKRDSDNQMDLLEAECA
ncbi:ogr/Delta-like zinc finger family protein [Pseudomonas sp. Marseille-Q5115]|uniref:ogr/Delta-like zinc finger family protein n=1 Tax=Pseudomonas sp. Marseille-Q5115 TaxID=2866593 RepID=UPI001CE499D1|nr:ogr/Delta-like zinc finger family protein [Pseudomonas sp. Marseille-Q5115]